MNRGDLVTVALAGDYGKPRPALVVQADQFDKTDSIALLLVTSKLFEAPLLRYTLEATPANGLRMTSQVQIDRPMSVRRSKAGAVIGRVGDEAMTDITRLLALFLGIV